jgi:HTH-type transcriptional repressor of NAD biosynthesis genes
MTVGIIPGKFLPPHRGHLTSILKAHTMVDLLYVVISEQPEHDALLCSQAGCSYISGKLRKKWLSQELQNIEGVKVILVDESNIPLWPTGLKEYRALVDKAISEKVDVIFHGDAAYNDITSFPDIKHIMIDPNRGRWPISGTEIRQDPLKHWDYIIGSARPFFAKRVLVTGTESCGKTTITKKLAKIYYTS